MSNRSQVQKVIEFLKSHPGDRYNARQIAAAIVEAYPEDYREKRQNPRFADERAFLSQVVAEIGAHKNQIISSDSCIFWQDKPRPRVYWYDSEKVADFQKTLPENESDRIPEEVITTPTSFTEQDLYPLLIEYLKTELHLYCQRIDEKRSGNTRGSGGNQWLHPDIVAMQPVDKEWHELIRSCVKQGAGQTVRLWSFEVKKELNLSNVRMSFFQAVSNSSWANEGYLVTTSMAGGNVEQELRMLSALHGIGIILLNPENPTESDMMLPAQARPEVDWQSVNRILIENADFKDYIELVSTYYQTGRLRPRDWNRA